MPSEAEEVSGVAGGFAGPTTTSAMPAPNCLFIKAQTLPPDFFDAFDFYECWDTSEPIGVEVAPFERCPVDFDLNGQADFFDAIDFLGVFDARAPGGDFDANGEYNALDVRAFVQLLAEGCP